MGDLSKNFSKLEIMCPCSCGADKISPVLIQKLQKVRDIIGRPVIITSGVRCEFYNASLKNSSAHSSHVPDDYGKGNAVDIACLNSKDRYELVEVAKFFLKGLVYRAVHMVVLFIWMLIDQKYKKSCGFIEKVEASLQPILWSSYRPLVVLLVGLF